MLSGDRERKPWTETGLPFHVSCPLKGSHTLTNLKFLKDKMKAFFANVKLYSRLRFEQVISSILILHLCCLIDVFNFN